MGITDGARDVFEVGLNNGMDPTTLDAKVCYKLGLCEWGYDLTDLFNGEETIVPVWYTESTFGYGIKV